MFAYNFHTHTHYCDGSSAPEEYVKTALAAGLKAIGFSGHAPVPFDNKFAIPNLERLREYCDEVRGLKKSFSQNIEIYLALEADYIPGITNSFDNFKNDYLLDYIIGSVHLVKDVDGGFWFIDGPDRDIWLHGLQEGFNGDIKKAVSSYYIQLNLMVEVQQPDVIGHLDKIMMHNQGEYFMEGEEWYRKLVWESLQLIKERGAVIEINTRGKYTKRFNDYFPGGETLNHILEMKIPVTISSDAHHPDEVSKLLDTASKHLKERGFREVYIFTGIGWTSIPLD